MINTILSSGGEDPSAGYQNGVMQALPWPARTLVINLSDQHSGKAGRYKGIRDISFLEPLARTVSELHA